MAVAVSEGGGGSRGFNRLERRLVIAAVVLLALVVAGGALVVRFVGQEWQRDLAAWQIRMGLVADSRYAAVDDWLSRQFADVTGLAENASLQLYMNQLSEGGEGEDADVMDAQSEYLRNLLEATAARAGFVDRDRGADVGANVQRVGTGGVALLDGNGRMVVGTAGMPPLAGPLRDFIAGLKPGERNLLDVHLNAAGRPAMAFAMPIFAVQGNRDAASQIGVVVGVKEVADELYPLLRQPGETNSTAITVLLRQNGAAIEYLSPLPDGTPPLSLRMAADTPDLDAAFAIDKPGGFQQRLDYRNRSVLVTSRRFGQAPWTLMTTIDRDAALHESQVRWQRLMAALFLGITALAIAFIAVWRHGSSLRAADAAARYREIAERFEAQSNLLRLVTDSQPTGIFILDAEGRYRFANREAGRSAGMAADDMPGKQISNVLGAEAARRHLILSRQVLETSTAASDVTRLTNDGSVHIFQTDHIPIAPSRDLPKGVLVVEHDITEVVTARERRARILSQIVRTLVGVVDRRDPYAADHSQRVAALARAIATEMSLSEREVDTAETAGNLLNLGKILVAPELLTKSGELSDDDRQKVRLSIQTSAELLEGIEFDGPVVMTLRQAQARWDGTGVPSGLTGEDILLTARIVSVANAFVGMVSRRAYREALPVDRAVEAVLEQVGKGFDRRVVVALINYLDNRGGRAQWAGRGEAPRGAA